MKDILVSVCNARDNMYIRLRLGAKLGPALIFVKRSELLFLKSLTPNILSTQKMFLIVWLHQKYILKIYRWENILSRKCYFRFSSVDNIHLRLKHPYEKTNKMIVDR